MMQGITSVAFFTTCWLARGAYRAVNRTATSPTPATLEGGTAPTAGLYSNRPVFDAPAHQTRRSDSPSRYQVRDVVRPRRMLHLRVVQGRSRITGEATARKRPRHSVVHRGRLEGHRRPGLAVPVPLVDIPFAASSSGGGSSKSEGGDWSVGRGEVRCERV
ncbi:hypothetical protein B0H13DRAFT_188200 [Mycena leptocephala]|nr:hypothetical protein B0H13DRAFT_188200 [Mycena leptocephala]